MNNIFLISSQNYKSINTIRFFRAPGLYDNYYYFSVLNPFYTSEKEKNYIINALNEIIKFVNVEINFSSYDQTLGSFILSDRKIITSIDSELAVDLVNYVKIVDSKTTKYGEVTCIKINYFDLYKIWMKFNNERLPYFDFELRDYILPNGVPSWFVKPPQRDGYIFGVGVYKNDSRTAYLFTKSDIAARTEVVNTLSIKIKSELYDYFSDNFELVNFFSNHSNKVTLGGIMIIRRYFDQKSKIAYSLAVYKYKE
ncbi:MAG TPA: hypothetical protein PLE45_10805 [Spirochaetota bacterium]|nr:hypothetical protein [Spirochaetota bacterium]HOL57862.1 hypothetical protein [Spirochaetota bacterium]HPP03750.1 hypothetical protein [Spirochaetota bacterium]